MIDFLFVKPLVQPIVGIELASSGPVPSPTSSPSPTPTPTPLPNPDAAIEVLFANNELGVWYDPSDLSTMFQTYNGSTPVTGTAQPVGLILDKSRGLELGPDAGPTASSVGGGGWTVTGTNQYTFAFTGGDLELKFGNGTFIPSEQFAKITFEITSISGGNVILRLKGINVESITTPGVYSFIAPAGTNSTYDITFSPQSNSVVMTVKNVSVRHIAGHHAYQSTAASRPVYRSDGLDFLEFDGIDDALLSQSYNWTSTNEVSALVGADMFGEFTNNIRPLLGLGYVYSSWIDNAWQLDHPYRSSVGGNRVYMTSRGTSPASSFISYPDGVPDITDVVWGEAKISTPISEIESMTSVTVFPSSATQGTGTYGNHPIRMAQGLSEYVAMNMYGAVARGKLTSDVEKEAARDWMAAKTGI